MKRVKSLLLGESQFLKIMTCSLKTPSSICVMPDYSLNVFSVKGILWWCIIDAPHSQFLKMMTCSFNSERLSRSPQTHKVEKKSVYR